MPFIDDDLLWCPDNDGKMVDLSCLVSAPCPPPCRSAALAFMYLLFLSCIWSLTVPLIHMFDSLIFFFLFFFFSFGRHSLPFDVVHGRCPFVVRARV